MTPLDQPLPEGAPPRVLLVGMMGAGKTTVGRLVSEKLGWDYLDRQTPRWSGQPGLTGARALRPPGEPAFRGGRSRCAFRRAGDLTQPVVVLSGGGSGPASGQPGPAGRRAGNVVWLRARPETLAARVGACGRPLWACGDPATALRELDFVRRPFYAEVADETIDVDRSSAPPTRWPPGSSTVAAGGGMVMRRVQVALGSRSYPVLIGHGARHELSRVLPATAKRAVVVTQIPVQEARMAPRASTPACPSMYARWVRGRRPRRWRALPTSAANSPG